MKYKYNIHKYIYSRKGKTFERKYLTIKGTQVTTERYFICILIRKAWWISSCLDERFRVIRWEQLENLKRLTTISFMSIDEFQMKFHLRTVWPKLRSIAQPITLINWLKTIRCIVGFRRSYGNQTHPKSAFNGMAKGVWMRAFIPIYCKMWFDTKLNSNANTIFCFNFNSIDLAFSALWAFNRSCSESSRWMEDAGKF